MATGASLEIDIREKRFAVLTDPLFRGLKLSVAPSATVALVGPSGVGKSSLLRLIAGVDNDYDGTIMVDGTAAARAATPGFVFQDPRLLPWLSASANVRAVRADITNAEASDLLSEVGLSGFENALPHELSGGMQRRVALARSLAIRPKLLLLDEPFVSLDRKLAHELHRVFARLIDTYRPTVVMVSHDADDAARLANRVIVLEGKPAQVSHDVSLDGVPGARDEAEIGRIAAQIHGETELA